MIMVVGINIYLHEKDLMNSCSFTGSIDFQILIILPSAAIFVSFLAYFFVIMSVWKQILPVPGET